MSVMITGGYGLLGSWVAYYLAREGQKVIMFDVKPKKLDYLEEVSDNLTPVRGSVLDWPNLLSTFKKFRGEIEGIIHTPAVMATPQYWNNPYHGSIVNITGSLNVYEMARILEVQKLVYISSGAVYGETKDNPSETTHPINPSDLYGASKASAEFLGLQYHNHYGLDFRIVRPYFFFGPGHLPSELPPLFKALFGPLEGLSDLQLEKGANQSLGFTYVKDTARGTVLVYKKDKPPHRAYNIAAREAINFCDLAGITKRYSPASSEVRIGPGKLFPRGETLDISLARKDLGFEPEYEIEKAIQEYAEWIKQNRR